MLDRFMASLRGNVPHSALQSAAPVSSSFATFRLFVTTAHHTLMVMGVLAIATLVTLVVKPDFTDHIKAFSPFATPPMVTVAAATDELAPSDEFAKPVQSPVEPSSSKDSHTDHLGISTDKPRQAVSPREQQWVTTWLAKRYRVASDATNMLVSAAYQTAKDTKLDPLLILSVMAIESGFNPFAESAVGAQGLMQVMSKIHHDKFQPLGGLKVALNPVANIKVGSLILKEYVSRGGSVEAGLKMYVGAAAFDNDAGYGSKVLAEYRRLQDVARGKNVPLFTAPLVIAPKPRPVEPAVEKPAPMIEAYNSPDAAAKNKTEDNEQVAAL